jgi:hypothetical protein
LSRRYPVTVNDRDLRPGGHSHTVTIGYDGTPLAVDSGFIVYNKLNYPDLTALFAHPGIETTESCMSFAVTADAGRVKLRILEIDREGPLPAATFIGRRLTNTALLRAFFALPLVTFKIVAAIHWEACGCGSKASDWCSAPMPQPPIPSWRLAKAMTILAQHCPRRPGGNRIRGEALWSMEGRIEDNSPRSRFRTQSHGTRWVRTCLR